MATKNPEILALRALALSLGATEAGIDVKHVDLKTLRAWVKAKKIADRKAEEDAAWTLVQTTAKSNLDVASEVLRRSDGRDARLIARREATKPRVVTTARATAFETAFRRAAT